MMMLSDDAGRRCGQTMRVDDAGRYTALPTRKLHTIVERQIFTKEQAAYPVLQNISFCQYYTPAFRLASPHNHTSQNIGEIREH